MSVFYLLGDSPTYEFSVPTFRKCVSKRRYGRFRRREITQKKEYDKEYTSSTGYSIAVTGMVKILKVKVKISL